ncbi:cysteine proteinase [Meredithblackwellia eburnea MCA 4105]
MAKGAGGGGGPGGGKRVIGRPRARSKTRAERPKLLEEDPAVSERVLNAQLKLMGLYAAHTIGDGNCLFRALSDQLYGSPNSHLQLRHQVCEFVASNPDRYRLFVDEDSVPGGFEGHLASMRIQGTYGTHIELSAVAQLSKRSIKVVQPGLVYVIKPDEIHGSSSSPSSKGKRKEGEEDEPEQLEGGEEGEARDEEGRRQEEENSREDSQPLYIVYHSWEHYSSLRNLGGPHVGLPQVREITPPPPPPPSATPVAATAPTPDLPTPMDISPKSRRRLATTTTVVPPRPIAPRPPPPPLLDANGNVIKRGRGRPRKYPLPLAPPGLLPETTLAPQPILPDLPPLDTSFESDASDPVSLASDISRSSLSNTPQIVTPLSLSPSPLRQEQTSASFYTNSTSASSSQTSLSSPHSSQPPPSNNSSNSTSTHSNSNAHPHSHPHSHKSTHSHPFPFPHNLNPSFANFQHRSLETSSTAEDSSETGSGTPVGSNVSTSSSEAGSGDEDDHRRRREYNRNGNGNGLEGGDGEEPMREVEMLPAEPAPVLKRGRGRPRKYPLPTITLPDGQLVTVEPLKVKSVGREKRERRMEEKRRKAELRSRLSGHAGELRRSRRVGGTPGLGGQEVVLGEVKELYI